MNGARRRELEFTMPAQSGNSLSYMALMDILGKYIFCGQTVADAPRAQCDIVAPQNQINRDTSALEVVLEVRFNIHNNEGFDVEILVGRRRPGPTQVKSVNGIASATWKLTGQYYLASIHYHKDKPYLQDQPMTLLQQLRDRTRHSLRSGAEAEALYALATLGGRN